MPLSPTGIPLLWYEATCQACLLLILALKCYGISSTIRLRVIAYPQCGKAFLKQWLPCSLCASLVIEFNAGYLSYQKEDQEDVLIYGNWKDVHCLHAAFRRRNTQPFQGCCALDVSCARVGFVEGRCLFAGRQEMFTIAMMMYAAASACIGATPAAYAADVMPQSVSGFGLGIYRCAGDIGGSHFALLPQHILG